jgi:hypothetical protein
VKTCRTPSILVMTLKNLLVKAAPLSVSTVSGIPNTAIHRSIRTCATADAVCSGKATATDILLNLYPMQNTNLFPRDVFGSGPNTSIAINSSGLFGGKIVNGVVFFGPSSRFLAAKFGHLHTVAKQSFAILGQYHNIDSVCVILVVP